MLSNLIRFSKQSYLLPFYHLVSDNENTFAKYLYEPRKINDFKNDLDLLLRYYTPVTLSQFIKLSQLKKQPKKPYFHLTFDDGLLNFHKIVAPILEEKKIPATVFLNTDFIDNKALFYRYKASLLIQLYEASNQDIKNEFHTFFKGEKNIKEVLLKIDFNNKEILEKLALKLKYNFDNYLKEEKPYLTTIQINDLIKRGFTIGAHSKNHPIYAKISLDEQIEQTIDSLKVLKKKFNLNYNAFSFPHTDLGVKKDFFIKTKSILDISFGTSGIKNDDFPTNFHRLPCEIGAGNLKSTLIKEYIKFFLKEPLRKNKMPRD